MLKPKFAIKKFENQNRKHLNKSRTPIKASMQRIKFLNITPGELTACNVKVGQGSCVSLVFHFDKKFTSHTCVGASVLMLLKQQWGWHVGIV